MPELDPRLARLFDKDQIRDVLATYARGVDRGDGPMLKSCYHPDAIEEHGGRYTGNAYEYVDGAIPRIRQMDAMQHVLGTSYFDFVTDDLAYVETYIVTLARVKVADEVLDTFTGGRLIDRFERRAGLWKIASAHDFRLEPRYTDATRLGGWHVRSRHARNAARRER